jgi:hypothetical protein
MSAQNDFSPGFDLTSLSSATQAQIMQAIAQITALSNIGLVYYSTTEPDVLNNPRFTRYLWIDPTDPTSPIVKRYKVVAGVGSWSVVGVGTAAITTAMLANFAVSVLQSDAATSKIALRTDGAADPSQANYVLKVDADGRYIEASSLNAFLQNAGPVKLARLDATDSADYFVINIVGGIITWRAFDPSAGIVANSLPLNKLQNTTRYYLAVAGGAGGVYQSQQFDPTNMISVDGLDTSRIPLTKLQSIGVAAHDIMELDANGNWVKKTPPLVNKFTGASTAVSAVISQLIAATPHNLGAIPSNIQIQLVNKANNGATGYVVGDIIPLDCVTGLATGVVTAPILSCQVDATNYTLVQSLGAPSTITHVGVQAKAGTGLVSVTVANFVLDWNVRVILFA